jgi:flagellar hook-associated protein 3 FlgL
MANSTRVPDLGQSMTMLSYLQRTQTDLSQARRQAASGQKADFYSEMGTKASQFLSLEQIKSQTQGYIDNNTYVDARIGVYEVALSKMIDIGVDYKVMLSQLRSANSQFLNNAPTLINNMLNEVASLLNSRDADGRYIFGGSRIDTPPVDLSLMIGYPATGGPPDYSYYKGDATILDITISDQLTIDYGILATNPAIEPLLRGLREGASMAFTTPLDQLRVGDAMANVDLALAYIPDLFAVMGSARAQILATNQAHEDYKSYINDIRSPLIDTDLAETLTHVTQLMSQLETSYALLQRLFSLTLTNYLR